MEGRGHTVLALDTCVSQPNRLLGWTGPALTELQTLYAQLPPALDDWLTALRASPLVRHAPLTADPASADADRGQPLVLGGTPEAPLLYLRRYWVHEDQVAAHIGQRVARFDAVDIALARVWLDRLFDRPAAADDVDWQKVACGLALRAGLTVITGGPGTGKTYTAARLLALLLALSPDPTRLKVALAAPTGKAAARLRLAIDQSLQEVQQRLGDALDLAALTERIGQARTLHALLGARPDTRQFRYHASHPLDVDVVIVDETSMVHLEMMAALLQALPARARLILLGDKDQLASVEAGSVLGDLCAQAAQARYNPDTLAYLAAVSGQQLSATDTTGPALAQQTVMLRHSRRFGSDIGQLAHAVNAGQAEVARDLLVRSAEASTGRVWLAPAPVAPAAVLHLALHGRPLAGASFADYLKRIQVGPQADTEDAYAAWVRQVLRAFDGFRILCAVHDGAWGERQINQDIGQALARAGLLRMDTEWFIGRPVMVTRNDAALGVANGDVGVVLPSGSAHRTQRVYFLDGEQLRSVAVSRLAHVETCFAMTIHKSQGSEFAHTVVVLPDAASDLLTRELLYTGITRARDFLSVVEPRPSLLGQAIARQFQRASGLQRKLGA